MWAGAEQGDGQLGQELVGKSFPGRREVQIKVGMGKEIEIDGEGVQAEVYSGFKLGSVSEALPAGLGV